MLTLCLLHRGEGEAALEEGSWQLEWWGGSGGLWAEGYENWYKASPYLSN